MKILYDASIADHVEEDGYVGMEVQVEEEIALEGAVLEEGEALAVFGAGVVTEGFAHGGNELRVQVDMAVVR